MPNEQVVTPQAGTGPLVKKGSKIPWKKILAAALAGGGAAAIGGAVGGKEGAVAAVTGLTRGVVEGEQRQWERQQAQQTYGLKERELDIAEETNRIRGVTAANRGALTPSAGAALARAGYKADAAGNAVPRTESELSETQRAEIRRANAQAKKDEAFGKLSIDKQLAVIGNLRKLYNNTVARKVDKWTDSGMVTVYEEDPGRPFSDFVLEQISYINPEGEDAAMAAKITGAASQPAPPEMLRRVPSGTPASVPAAPPPASALGYAAPTVLPAGMPEAAPPAPTAISPADTTGAGQMQMDPDADAAWKAIQADWVTADTNGLRRTTPEEQFRKAMQASNGTMSPMGQAQLKRLLGIQ